MVGPQWLPMQVRQEWCGEIPQCEWAVQVSSCILASLIKLNWHDRDLILSLLIQFQAVTDRPELSTKSLLLPLSKKSRRSTSTPAVSSPTNSPKSRRLWQRRPTIGRYESRLYKWWGRSSWREPDSTTSWRWASKLWRSRSCPPSRTWGRRLSARPASRSASCRRRWGTRSTASWRPWCRTSSTWSRTRPRSCRRPASSVCDSSFRTPMPDASFPSSARTSTPSRGRSGGRVANFSISCCTHGRHILWRGTSTSSRRLSRRGSVMPILTRGPLLERPIGHSPIISKNTLMFSWTPSKALIGGNSRLARCQTRRRATASTWPARARRAEYPRTVRHTTRPPGLDRGSLRWPRRRKTCSIEKRPRWRGKTVAFPCSHRRPKQQMVSTENHSSFWVTLFWFPFSISHDGEFCSARCHRQWFAAKNDPLDQRPRF